MADLEAVVTNEFEDNDFVVRFDDYGEYVWSMMWSSNSEGFINLEDVASDDKDNLYAIGNWGTNFGSSGAEHYLNTDKTQEITADSSNGASQGVLVKYNAKGEILWRKEIVPDESYGSATFYAVETDSKGAIYVLGSSFGDNDLDNDGMADLSGDTSNGNIFIAKYSQAGKVVQANWLVQNAPPSSTGYINSYDLELTLDSSDNLYITGTFSDGDIDLGNGNDDGLIFSGTRGGTTYESDSFVAKLNSNAEVQWVKGFGTDHSQFDISDIAINNSGQVYLSGNLGLRYSVTEASSFNPNNLGSYNTTLAINKTVSVPKISIPKVAAQTWYTKTDEPYPYLTTPSVLMFEADGSLSPTAAGNTIVSGGGIEPGAVHSLAIDGRGNINIKGEVGLNFYNQKTGESGVSEAFLSQLSSNLSTLSRSVKQSGISAYSTTDLFVDSDGILYDIIDSYWSADLDGDAEIDIADSFPGFVAQYGKSGGQPEFQKAYALPSWDNPQIDAAGNLYLSGSFNEPMDIDGDGDADLIADDGSTVSYGMAKFDAQGDYLWSVAWQTIAGVSDSLVLSETVVDGAGNLYVVGYSLSDTTTVGTYDFDEDSIADLTVGAGNYGEAFIVKYSPNGDREWQKTVAPVPNGLSAFRQVDIDSDGKINALGELDGQNVIVKYDTQGNPDPTINLGNSVWANEFVLDAQDNIYIAGSFSWNVDLNADGLDDLVYSGRPNSYKSDTFVAKYKKDGTFLWAKSIGTADSEFTVSDFVVSATGHVYLAGNFGLSHEITDSVQGQPVNLNSYDTTIDMNGNSQDDLFLPGNAANWYDSRNDYYLLNSPSVLVFDGGGTFVDSAVGAEIISAAGTEPGMVESIAVDADNNVYASGSVGFSWYDNATNQGESPDYFMSQFKFKNLPSGVAAPGSPPPSATSQIFAKTPKAINFKGGKKGQTLSATPGGKNLKGGSDNDTLKGDDKNNRLVGKGGNDQIFGDGGKDKISGGGGNDQLLGENGKDQIKGGGGADLLNGGNDKDKLIGGGGNDILIGGKGNDILIGGGGIDTFRYEKANEGTDKIKKFQVGTDLIDVSAILSQTSVPITDFGKYIILQASGSGTSVFTDPTGTGTMLAENELAVLTNVPLTNLTATSFIV